MAISSRTLRSWIRPPVCSIAPTSPSATASLAVFPNNDTDPASGVVKPSSMSIVVDFPAPFGPRSATVSPGAIETSTPCDGPDDRVARPERLDEATKLDTGRA